MLDIYGKTDVPSMGHGRIEIAGVVLQGDDVTKLSNILDGHYRPKGSAVEDTAGEQAQIPQDQITGSVDPKLVIEQNIADAKMTALMSQTLTQKEEIIKQFGWERLKQCFDVELMVQPGSEGKFNKDDFKRLSVAILQNLLLNSTSECLKNQ